MSIQKALYRFPSWTLIFLPLTLVFWALSSLRRLLYNLGVFNVYKSKLPVIVVGNISAGGNGKTPVVIALIEHLIKKGIRPAVLSRGYGGEQESFPFQVNQNASAKVVGDEPWMIFERYKIPVIIDPNRVRGAKLIEDFTDAEVIICDDGMQHYALYRDIEICVMDDRGIGNGFLLPTGPLRESKVRLDSVDIVVVNAEKISHLDCLHGISTDIVQMTFDVDQWFNVSTKESMNLKQARECFAKQERLTALAGIGNPDRFFQTIKRLGIEASEYRALSDHYDFEQNDFNRNEYYVMTEKDAVKCQSFSLENAWYLPISARLPDSFYDFVDTKIKLKYEENV